MEHLDPADLELQTLRALIDFAGRRVLEVGAGDGRLSFPFAAQAAQWVALESDGEELRLAVAPGVSRTQADARRLPFPAGVFDVVFLSYALC